MRRTRAFTVLASLAIGLSLLLASCQSSTAQSSSTSARLDNAAVEQEVQEMMAMGSALDARLREVAPGVWVDLRADGVRIHMDPPFFTKRTLPQFESYLQNLDVNSIAKDRSVAEMIQGQLNDALDNVKLEWENLQRLSPTQKQELYDRFVKPNLHLLQSTSVAPAYLLHCTRASAMRTTAGPGAKAYAKGSCVNAYNNSYARAEAEGSVRQKRDSGRDGSYASAVKYGNWGCSSYGAASAYVTVAGFPQTISSDSDSHSGCN